MNPLAIRIAADLKAFKANMAEMRVQLETNAAAMKRMSSSFDGRKVIGDANAMVKSIHDIGGASKLTESEMRRVNGTVTEALAKYKALGREAPKELIALRDATAKVNAEAAKTPSLMDKMSTRATALGVAVGTFVGNIAWSAVNKLGAELGEFAKQGMQLQAVQSSFERLARGVEINSSEMLSTMQKASRGMVSEFDLMKIGNKALLLGLPITTESMGVLTKAAVTLGRAMGQDAAASVDDMIVALGRSSPKILDNLGIMVDASEANDLYAEKMKIVGRELTDAEKKLAFYEEAMRKANEKTKELGESTKTLGEMLQTTWVSVGNIVTGVVSDYNIGLGSALSSTQNFGRFLSVGMSQGFAHAIQLFAAMERGKGIVAQLTDSQKKYVDELIRAKGIDVVTEFAKGDKAMMAYIATLDLGKKKTGELTDEQKKALEAAKKLREEFQKKVDSWTGVQAQKDLAALRKEIDAAGGVASLSRAKYEELENRLISMRKSGALLAGEFANIWLSHERLNPSIKVTTDAYKILSDTMKNVKPVTLGMPVPTNNIPISGDPYGIIKQIEHSLILAGKDTRIKLAAAPIGATILDSIAKALEGLGSVIVGAIQGGGNVGSAAFAHIGLSLGNDLGAAIAKGLGGQLGKIIGGFAGPIGSLLGGAVGGLIDNIFGKNEGRDMAKEFAAMQGGFDALREKMLILGDEGERLWIALTQNTQGPAQVAATIREIEDALREAEEQAKKTGQTIVDTFQGPEGARGFPTRAQLQSAAADAKAAYDYMLASGEYTEEVLTQAWENWADAAAAAGDKTLQNIKKLNDEIISLQEAIAEELPEYDENNVRIYGVIEQQNIDRLAALEAEKAALNLQQIAKELHATEVAAAAADLMAQKEFDAAKGRAIHLDADLRRIFAVGYTAPITFTFPGGIPGGGGGGVPPGSSPSSHGGPLPPPRQGTSSAPVTITVVSQLDGQVVAQNQVKYIPRELSFIGARR